MRKFLILIIIFSLGCETKSLSPFEKAIKDNAIIGASLKYNLKDVSIDEIEILNIDTISLSNFIASNLSIPLLDTIKLTVEPKSKKLEYDILSLKESIESDIYLGMNASADKSKYLLKELIEIKENNENKGFAMIDIATVLEKVMKEDSSSQIGVFKINCKIKNQYEYVVYLDDQFRPAGSKVIEGIRRNEMTDNIRLFLTKLYLLL